MTAVDSWAALREYKKAIHLSGLKPTVKLLALCLAEHANEKYQFRAWPSQQVLADETGTWRRTVRARIKELIDAGWITSDGGGQHKAARYTFHQVASNQRPIGVHESAPSVASDQRHQMASDQRHQMASDQRPDSPKDVPKKVRRTITSAATHAPARLRRSGAAAPLEKQKAKSASHKEPWSWEEIPPIIMGKGI